MIQLVPIIAGGGLVLCAAWAIGRAAWRFEPPAETLALAAGAPLLSFAIFVLLSRGLAAGPALACLCAAASATLLWKRPRLGKAPWKAGWIVTAVLAAYGAVYLLCALAPEIQPDGSTYHLGLVADWLRLRRFSTMQGFYQVMPLGVETLFAPAFAVGRHSAAKLVEFGFLAATVPLILRAGASAGLSRQASLGAAALYAVTPVVGISGTAAYNDAALVFHTLAAFVLLAEDEAEPRRWWPWFAGLAAGFCYAIKMTGLVVPLGGMAWLLARRRFKSFALFAAAAVVSIAPWTLRAWITTGNPFAPLGSRWFPNEGFHRLAEEYLARSLSELGGVSWWQLPRQLLLDGDLVQGLLGPCMAIALLALVAGRRRQGRRLLAAALLLALPWAVNMGTRFLMPPLPFLCLALAMVLPARALPPLVAAHALLSFPAVTAWYARQGAWILKEVPWRAALRIEPEEEYLRRANGEYAAAAMVARHAPEAGSLLDMHGLAAAYLPTLPLGPMPCREFDNLAGVLADNASRARELWALQARWELGFARALRVRTENTPRAQWAVAELEVLRRGRPVPPTRRWFVDAWPNAPDAWMAADRNQSSSWSLDGPAQAGAYAEVRFDRPMPIDGARVVMSSITSGQDVALYVEDMDRHWHRVGQGAPFLRIPPVNTRLQAVRFARDAGIRWIAVRLEPEGFGIAGLSMQDAPRAWGVELVDRAGPVALFRLR